MTSEEHDEVMKNLYLGPSTPKLKRTVVVVDYFLLKRLLEMVTSWSLGFAVAVTVAIAVRAEPQGAVAVILTLVEMRILVS